MGFHAKMRRKCYQARTDPGHYYGKISSGKENQQRQENGDEMMQSCVENYQRRDRVSSGGIGMAHNSEAIFSMSS